MFEFSGEYIDFFFFFKGVIYPTNSHYYKVYMGLITKGPPSIPNVFFPTIFPMNPQKQTPARSKHLGETKAPCYCYPPGSMLCVDPQAEVSVKFVPHRGVAFHRKNDQNLNVMMSCDVKGIQPKDLKDSSPPFVEVKGYVWNMT